MLRVITLLKRRTGMSLSAFIDYYESHHRVIGDKYLEPHAIGYRRKFLQPMASPADSGAQESAYDVVMEIDFESQAAMEACFAILASPEAQEEIVADEEKLFDRTKTQSFIAQEYASAWSQEG